MKSTKRADVLASALGESGWVYWRRSCPLVSRCVRLCRWPSRARNSAPNWDRVSAFSNSCSVKAMTDVRKYIACQSGDDGRARESSRHPCGGAQRRRRGLIGQLAEELDDTCPQKSGQRTESHFALSQSGLFCLFIYCCLLCGTA